MPVIYIVKDQNDVQLFISSAITLIVCLSILLLLFVPKIVIMRKGERGLPSNYQEHGSRWMASHASGVATSLVSGVVPTEIPELAEGVVSGGVTNSSENVGSGGVNNISENAENVVSKVVTFGSEHAENVVSGGVTNSSEHAENVVSEGVSEHAKNIVSEGVTNSSEDAENVQLDHFGKESGNGSPSA